MTLKRSFASDNNAGFPPEILKSIAEANRGHAVAYGDDPYTKEARALFCHHFGSRAKTFFVSTGTAANILSLQALTRSYEAVICTDCSHLHVDECGGLEKFAGSKLYPVAEKNGKLTPSAISPYLHYLGSPHHSQPRVISITQPTEVGTIYTLEEIAALSELARENDLYLHMDGARLALAAERLGKSFRELTKDVGVDVLSFGGTKAGMMMGEAVVFLREDLAENFLFYQKQFAQLCSKMRFISVQFTALLTDELWKKNAQKANERARILAQKVRSIGQVEITREVETNAIFARLPAPAIPLIQKEYFFYIWDHDTSEVRWMTSFDTTEEDIEDFVTSIKEKLQELSTL